MKPLRIVRQIPEPLRTLLVLWIIAGIVTFAGAWFIGPRMLLFPGAAGALAGVALALDLNGGARALAAAVGSRELMGVDYSGTVFASARYFRLVGAGAAVIGCLLIAEGASQL